MNDDVASAGTLSVEDIEFSYGSLQVLFGVSLDVQQGESLALLGTNGAGKSTLLKVICGLERPRSGTITYAGRDVTGIATERLPGQGLVLVSGGHTVFGDLTVAENLEVLAMALRKRRGWFVQRKVEVLDLFPRLGERLGQRAGNLSGGEQQQLALAKAILLEPAVLCLDELSLGLAPIVVQDLIAVVRGLQADGVTLVLVEQSLNIAASLCPRAIFMEKGTVRFEGRTAELLERQDIARAVFLGDGDDAPRRPGPLRAARRTKEPIR